MSQIIDNLLSFSERYRTLLTVPKIMWTDIVEIIIIAFLIYRVLAWIKDTRAWSLMKGLSIILIFILIAALFSMTTILWIVKNIFSVAIMAIVVVFQPELRKALEHLGKTRMFSSLLPFDSNRIMELFSDHTISEIVRASYEMGRARTGALIVIENNDSLSDYEKTGIVLDSEVSSQLLINIFEHNTPLHDGAVIIRGNRITTATCYLPLSDNMKLSKELGTRHRAGVGISEATDSLTIIVSEETGRVSVAEGGVLTANINAEELTKRLEHLQNKVVEEKKFKLWKGRSKDEKESDK
ncbi:MAG: diadenylate cyclase CdaA, partial [Lachnospiraceae bacterium]|nr:diadenylate cyclase CdaA [Lachnospiraceae bacterium]